MLINFFKNSKSFSFILITVFTVFLFLGVRFPAIPHPFHASTIFHESIVLIIFLGTLFLTNHLARKNHPKTAGSIVAFCLMLLLFYLPQVLVEDRVIYSTFFSVLGMRRLLAVRNQRSILKKIFDSSIFLTIALFIYPPAAPFMLLPFFTILAFLHLDYRYFLVPLTALAATWILCSSYTLFVNDQFFNPFSHLSIQSYSPDLIKMPLYLMWALIFISLLLLFSLIRQGLTLPIGTSPEKKWFLVQLFLVLSGIATLFLSPFYNTPISASLLFLCIPFAIIIGGYFSMPLKKQIKEILLLVFLTGSVFFILNYNFLWIS